MHNETYKLLAWNDTDTLKQWEKHATEGVERDKARVANSFPRRHDKHIGPTSWRQTCLSDIKMLKASRFELEAVRMELRTRENCPDYNHREEHWRRWTR